MVEGHDRAVVSGDGVDDERVWERLRLCDEAVVAADGHALVRGVEEASGSNLERGGLAVPWRGRPPDPAAERVDDALVAEADAEEWEASVIGVDEAECVGGLLGRAGPRPDENRSRRPTGDMAGELASGAHDLDLDAHRGESVDEVERKGVSVVYEEEHGIGCRQMGWLLGRSGEKFQGWADGHRDSVESSADHGAVGQRGVGLGWPSCAAADAVAARPHA